MNKNKLIALTLAAIYQQRAVEVAPCIKSELAPMHDTMILEFDSELLDYLREKEGKNITRYDSKAMTKIAKVLLKKHNIHLFVDLTTVKKGKTFKFNLARVPKIGTVAGSLAALSVFILTNGSDEGPMGTVGHYRRIRNLDGKKDKKQRNERDGLIAGLEDRAKEPRFDGEVAQAA